MIDLGRYHQRLRGSDPVQLSGDVTRVVGLSVIASGPAVPVGDLCRISGPTGSQLALTVGFREGEMLLQPLGTITGIRPGDRVEALGRGLEIPVGPGLVGRVIDGVGNPIDGKGPIPGRARRAVEGQPPPALSRRPIGTVLETGFKVIDTVFTVGKGQRMGIFAGSGVGKSVLLGELARNASADINVIALVGERGREIGEFVGKILGPEGLARSVVIASSSDRPAVERVVAAQAAHAVAEHFRDTGLDVLLMMDSVTRLCHGQREIGLSAGEPPTVRGYPPSAFAMLPTLLERAGTSEHGSITAFYTVLMDADEDADPVADNVRAILDGHLFLSREMAGRAIYPAIDLARSVSRLIVDLVPENEHRLSLRARELWGEYERVRDLVEIGAYEQGTNATVDQAIACHPRLVAFVKQEMGLRLERAESLELLRSALGQAAFSPMGEGAEA
ncbi:MAG: FliI/YscN family ATPase [Halochromatium sp.]